MRFLVLGSNSFSGSHFIKELLTKNYEVIGVSRSPEPHKAFLPYYWQTDENKILSLDKFKFFQLDINKDIKELLALINEFKPEYIVNFAAQGMVAESWLNPTHWYRTNLLSQVEFHDELRKNEFIKKYVHISTPEVYGDTENWIAENNIFNPTTPYSVSRAACDMHLLSFYKAYGFPVVFTRAANVFGEGQQLYRIIPRTILAIKSGKKLQLHGGGFSKRSFIHIKDVVEGTLKLALNGEPGSSWHLSTKSSLMIRELVSIICKMQGVSFNYIVEEVGERLGKDKNYLLESNKIRNTFNWEDKISLEEGINRTIKWIDENYSVLAKLPWNYQHKS